MLEQYVQNAQRQTVLPFIYVSLKIPPEHQVLPDPTLHLLILGVILLPTPRPTMSAGCG